MYKRALSHYHLGICALSISDPGKKRPPGSGRSLSPFKLSYCILHTAYCILHTAYFMYKRAILLHYRK